MWNGFQQKRSRDPFHCLPNAVDHFAHSFHNERKGIAGFSRWELDVGAEIAA